MKVLVIGGSLFLGRHIVEAALARGHTVTTFNRGKTGRGQYPEVEELHGNRDGGLGPLQGRSFDAVLDTCGYVPRVVRQSAELLADKTSHYTFVSSLSVYPDYEPDTDEAHTLATTDEPESEEVMKHYGALKALCERVLEEAMPGRVLQARAGLLVGPYDRMERFNYWLRRVHQGGDVLAPGTPESPLQLIDARDLADWLLRKAEDGLTGAFNLTGPARPLSFGELLDGIRAELGSNARWVWVADEFLAERQLAPMDGVPLWIPREARGFYLRRIERALGAGLKFRPLAETVRDTWAELSSRPAPEGPSQYGLKSALPSEREREVVLAWRARPVP